MRTVLPCLLVTRAAALSASTNAALKQAIDLVHRKHDAATARASQPFQTWSDSGEDVINVPVDVEPYAYPPNCTDVPELFAAAPCKPQRPEHLSTGSSGVTPRVEQQRLLWEAFNGYLGGHVRPWLVTEHGPLHYR